jgi:hypothetical protein
MSNRYQAAVLTASYFPLQTPNAPTIGTATDLNASGGGQVSVTFTAPANVGGGAITGFTVISNPSGITGSGASSPITVSGLSNGTPYTFTAVATNAYGTGPASAASNSATPTAYVYPGIQTLAVFAIDNNSAGLTNRYIYSGNVVAVSTSLTFANGTGMAAGNSILGIWARGDVTTTTNKYTYASDVTAVATAMNGSVTGTSYGMAASNSTFGIFATGSTGSATSKYTYSGDTVALTTNVNSGFIGQGMGNSSVGIFTFGASASPNNGRNKYTYSTDSVSAATASAFTGAYYGAGCGTSTAGISATGNNGAGAVASTQKYTYSGDVSALATSLTQNAQGMGAAGGNTVGIFLISNSTKVTNVYTYSGDTVAVGTSLNATTAPSNCYGASNGTTGVNV